MTVQEEEAALLAVSAVLEWETKIPSFATMPFGFVWDVATHRDADGHRDYTVSLNPGVSLQASARVACWERNGHLDRKRQEANNGSLYATRQRWYPTVTEAKATCVVNCFAFDEVHAATGAFPPSPHS